VDLVAFSPIVASILPGERPPAGRPTFRRGDVDGDGDGDGRIEVNDPIAILGRLFLGTEPFHCEDAADSDDDGEVNLTDVIVTLSWLFLGGEPLPPPGPERCGEDLSADGLADCSGGC
jgi:hypothetical protein